MTGQSVAAMCEWVTGQSVAALCEWVTGKLMIAYIALFSALLSRLTALACGSP